uniref:Uncharacterized protein n=1 Tax=Timema douglasi TaxID=61478 RepID=A0A7R8ZI88_TIMDO|nr:unnamed protein product [Timema douglasi]
MYSTMNHLATILLVAGLAVCWSEPATSAAVDAPLPYMYLLQPVYIRAADEEGSQPLVEEQQHTECIYNNINVGIYLRHKDVGKGGEGGGMFKTGTEVFINDLQS